MCTVEWQKQREAAKALKALNRPVYGEYGTGRDDTDGEDGNPDDVEKENHDPFRLHQCGRCLQMVPRGHNAGKCDYGSSPMPVKKKKPRVTNED